MSYHAQRRITSVLVATVGLKFELADFTQDGSRAQCSMLRPPPPQRRLQRHFEELHHQVASSHCGSQEGETSLARLGFEA